MREYFLNDDSNHLIKEFKPRKRNNNFHYKIEILENTIKKSNFAKIIELSNDEEEELNKNYNLSNENELTNKNIISYSNDELLNLILSKFPMLNIYKIKNTYTIKILINNMHY